jgi:hypothetical protein
MHRAFALILVLATPGVALAQTGTDMLNKAAKGAVDAVIPPGEAPADAAKAAETPPPKPGDMVNNPPYAHWSQFAIGTSVTTKEAVTLTDGTIAEAVITSKLISKSKDKLTVETVVTAGGAGKQTGAVEQTKTLTDFPAKVKFEQANTPAAAGYAVTEGKELVDVKGKQVEAEWVEATATNGEETVVEKVWTARDVPGGIVKQTVTTKKGAQVTNSSVTELVEYVAKPEAKQAPAKP